MKKACLFILMAIMLFSCGSKIERKAREQFKKTTKWIDNHRGLNTEIKDFDLYYKTSNDSLVIYKYRVINEDCASRGYYVYSIREDGIKEGMTEDDFVKDAENLVTILDNGLTEGKLGGKENKELLDHAVRLRVSMYFVSEGRYVE